jgi:hypothetical protein
LGRNTKKCNISANRERIRASAYARCASMRKKCETPCSQQIPIREKLKMCFRDGRTALSSDSRGGGNELWDRRSRASTDLIWDDDESHVGKEVVLCESMVHQRNQDP